MTDALGDWGSDLGEMERARALAALGVAQAYRWAAGRPAATGLAEIEADVLAAVAAGLPVRATAVPWLLTASPDGLPAGSAARLAAVWSSSAHPLRVSVSPDHPPTLSLAIRPTGFTRPILSQLFAILPASDDWTGVYVREQLWRPDPTWHWPLRAGCLGDADSRTLAEALAGGWACRPDPGLATVVDPGRSGTPCELLLLPWTLAESVARLGTIDLQSPCACVAVLDGATETGEELLALKDGLLRLTRASGLFVGRVEAPVEWFDRRLMWNLAHNMPLDVCLRWAPADLFFATPPLLAVSQLAGHARYLADRIAAWPGDPELTVPGGLGLPAGRQSAQALAAALRERAPQRRYGHEDQDGRELAGVGRLVDALADAGTRGATGPAAPNPAPPRFLQAQVAVAVAGQPAQRLRSALLAGRRHTLSLRIGPFDEDWLAPLPKPAFAFPTEQLPPEPDGHSLAVVVVDPTMTAPPVQQALFLPPTGPSEPALFTLDAPPAGTTLERVIMVLHQQDLLYTARLTAPVVNDLAELTADDHIALTVAEVLRATPPDRPRADVALRVERLADGADQVVGHAASATTVGLYNIQGFTKRIRDRLTGIAAAPEPFEGDITAAGTLTLLHFLAVQGRGLYQALCVGANANPALGDAGWIEVVSATPQTYLPLEFVYDRAITVGGTPQLCPNAARALRDGTCPNCPSTGAGGEQWLCPLGFWGLSKVIVRHVNDNQAAHGSLGENTFQLLASTAPSDARDSLNALDSALFAASEKVDLVAPGGSAAVLSALQAATGNHATQASTWQGWKDAVRSGQPSLLVLVAHKEENAALGVAQLEIGSRERLADIEILPDAGPSPYVVSDAAPAPYAPVVLLLGCQTQAADVSFQGFVPKLRDGGAAIVLATLATVLGRHTAPVAELIVATMDELVGDVPTSFGQVMLQVRRRALAAGLPMVLGLCAFGDADWLLAQ